MKKIFAIFIFVAAISFFACDQDLTGYEFPNRSDNNYRIYPTPKVDFLLNLCLP